MGFGVVAGIWFLFISLTVLSVALEGGRPLATTHLTQGVGPDAQVLPVQSTGGFDPVGVVFVGGEAVCYGGKTAQAFVNLVRGCKGTRPMRHGAGARVYNEASGYINSLIGFDVAEAMSTVGAVRTVVMLPGALGRALAKVITWDYVFLEGVVFGVPLVYMKYLFLYPLSGAFVLTLFLAFLGVFQGIARLFR